MVEDTAETVTAAQVEPGDVVTLPGVSGRHRVQLARCAVPGVVWLYVADATTGARRRGHVALTLHQEITRHGSPFPRHDRAPEDT